MKTRLIVYPLLILFAGIVFAFMYYPPLRHSIFVARMMGEELRPPVTSGEGSPILYAVLDMNGDGIAAAPIGTPPVLFDHIGNGVRIATTWITAKDGFIALDLNRNGVVDDGTELIGNHFKSATAGRAENSFKAFSSIDDNHDGVIDTKDAVYSKLTVWQDRNSDGICQSTEMRSLEKSGVTAIKTNEVAQRILGTRTVGSGNFELTSLANSPATTREFLDLGFEVDTFRRAFVTEIPISTEAAKLPDMRGSGMVRDMREAASLSPAFAKKLTEYSTAASREEQLKLLDSLVTEWGNTTGFADVKTRAVQNGYLLSADLDAKTLSLLTTLEQFNGRSFAAMPWEEEHLGFSARQGLIIGWDGNPKHLKLKLYPVQLNPLSNAYKTLKDSVYMSLLTQTRLRPYYEAIDTVTLKDSFTYDFSPVRKIFATRFQHNPEGTIVDLIEFNKVNRETWKDQPWTSMGDQVLKQMLSEVTPSPSLQKDLSDFSITIPPKVEQAKVEPGATHVADATPADKPRKGKRRVPRKTSDLRYCLELKDNFKIILCTETGRD